jgi:hypothetical protein
MHPQTPHEERYWKLVQLITRAGQRTLHALNTANQPRAERNAARSRRLAGQLEALERKAWPAE